MMYIFRSLVSSFFFQADACEPAVLLNTFHDTSSSAGQYVTLTDPNSTLQPSQELQQEDRQEIFVEESDAIKE